MTESQEEYPKIFVLTNENMLRKVDDWDLLLQLTIVCTHMPNMTIIQLILLFFCLFIKL